MRTHRSTCLAFSFFRTALLQQLTHTSSPTVLPQHKQLQPFTRLPEGQVTSYHHYVARRFPNLIPMLDTQYRMHPTIAQLVSELFYDSALVTDPAIAADREGLEVPGVVPVSWKDCVGVYLGVFVCSCACVRACLCDAPYHRHAGV